MQSSTVLMPLMSKVVIPVCKISFVVTMDDALLKALAAMEAMIAQTVLMNGIVVRERDPREANLEV